MERHIHFKECEGSLFRLRTREAFSNGYVFDYMEIKDMQTYDEDHHVDENSEVAAKAQLSRTVGDIDIYYSQDEYLFSLFYPLI